MSSAWSITVWKSRWGKALAWLVLAVSLGITAGLWDNSRRRVESEAQQQFDARAREIIDGLLDLMRGEQKILAGAVALFSASNVDRATWRQYVQALDLSNHDPGIFGIGFARRIPEADLVRHTADMRTEGHAGYEVRPPGPRNEYLPIVYLEALTGEDQPAIGFDMYTEPVRRAAMEQARDTGQARLSGRVTLAQNAAVQGTRHGFLLFMPVYRKLYRIDSPEARRTALLGYVYSAHLSTEFFRSIQHRRTPGLNLTILDADAPEGTAPLFSNLTAGADENLRAALFQYESSAQVAGHEWKVRISSGSEFERSVMSNRPVLYLLNGLLLSALLFGLTWVLAVSEARAQHQVREVAGALRTNEARLELAAAGSNTGIWDWDLQTDKVYYSPIWKRQLGYEVDEIGEDLSEWNERVHPDDKPYVSAAVEAYRDGRLPEYYVEFRMRHRDGSYRWIATRGAIIADPDTGVRRFVGTHQEITQRKQAEEELRRAHAALDAKVTERTRELQDANRILAQRHSEAEMLSTLAEVLQASVDAQEARHAFERFAVQLLPRFMGVLYTLHNSRNFLECVARWGEIDGAMDEVLEPDDCWALRVAHIRQYPGHDGMQCNHFAHRDPSRERICAPLSAKSEIMGLLYFELRPGEALGIQSWERALASALSDQLALALSNIRLRDTLREQSVRDPMTGLYNRRYFEETLIREMARSQRKHIPLAVAMIDVDNFKQFNDSHGHAAGDAALLSMAQLLNQYTRASDVACRYGGEEFVLLLLETSLEDARLRLESIRTAVAESGIRTDNQFHAPLSISVGIAVFPRNGEDIHTLVNAADSAMYEAKHAGRNRVFIAHDPLESTRPAISAEMSPQ